jgi:hypothetical protein
MSLNETFFFPLKLTVTFLGTRLVAKKVGFSNLKFYSSVLAYGIFAVASRTLVCVAASRRSSPQ